LYFVSNILVHITRTAINSSDIENNSSEPNTGLGVDERPGSECEIPSPPSTRSSTPTFSDHASNNFEESDEQNEPENDKNLSEKLSDTHTKQQPDDHDGDDVPATGSIQGFYSNNPTTATPINQQPHHPPLLQLP
jgi:hypothetical protein